MRYAVIMAGGQGKRLWPLSRQRLPKQLLKLVEGKSLMQIAVERLQGMFTPEQIIIVANKTYTQVISESIPEIPRENIIGEPEGRDTANAIALAAAFIAGKDPLATMAVFTADHIIRPHNEFLQSLNLAIQTAEADPTVLVTFGIHPSWPHVGLGYIKAPEKISDDVRQVEAFKEKPDHTTARRYVESGKYFWNSGMFVWTIPAIQSMLRQFLPDSLNKLQAVTDAVATNRDYDFVLAEIFPTLEKISVDYAIMEKAPNVKMVALNCEWIDLGSWPALDNVIEPDQQGNSIIADKHVIMDSFRNVIVNDVDKHMIAVLGLDDCIVIHSHDATLVCRKSDNQRLKELVTAIERDHGMDFL